MVKLGGKAYSLSSSSPFLLEVGSTPDQVAEWHGLDSYGLLGQAIEEEAAGLDVWRLNLNVNSSRE